jgi:hypothetical protein
MASPLDVTVAPFAVTEKPYLSSWGAADFSKNAERRQGLTSADCNLMQRTQSWRERIIFCLSLF